MKYQSFSLLTGFLVWLIATILFRLFGQYFFLTYSVPVMIGLYASVVPILGLVATFVFNRYELNRAESINSAVLMVIPGMILDTFCIQFFAWVFPNLPESAGTPFGSWLMWAYASVLVFGLLRKEG